MITLRYYDGGVQRSLDLMIDHAKDLKPIFKIYTPWLRRDIQENWPDSPPLAPSTLAARERNKGAVAEKIRAGTMGSLGRRLGEGQKKVKLRLEKRSAAADAYEVGSKGARLRQSAERAYARTEKLRAEYERIKEGGYYPIRKDVKKLAERIGRRHEQADEKIRRYESGEALGRIMNSFSVKIESSYMEMYSQVKWAGIHNEGGTAGHGASIPARPFLYWNAPRIQKLSEITQEYLLRPMKK